ncbi:carboxy methyl transferase for protein phosphatase 2A [Ascosphaera aggregata]|nr:carboxy methyl transferase for protein phosphatase 2A [Ascosphaera aggregata]
MAAPSIPNLNTLRQGKSLGRGGRGRDRGRGREGFLSRRGAATVSKDQVVQQTDNDASISRLSAVELGYFDDPFSRALCPNAVNIRRQPIINRGTYARSSAIDILVDRFLDSDPNTRKQIISLGAGSDTRPFRIFSKRPREDVLYHELDFAANTIKKIRYIVSVPILTRGLGFQDWNDLIISETRDALHSSHYHIHPIDLRQLSPSTPATHLKGVEPGLPTLLLSECCLIYLPPQEADDVLAYFTQALFPSTTPLSFILYEPTNPHDAFGKTMVANLATRGIILETIGKYDSLGSERKRLLDNGLTSGQGAANIDFLWERWIIQREKDRVAGIEMLDELEEWKLLSQHYCVAWGWREPEDSHLFQSWRSLPSQE